MADEVDPLEDFLEGATWNALVLLFYSPVTLGCLLWLYVYGGEWAVWDRTLGDEPLRDALLGSAVGFGMVLATRLWARTGPGVQLTASLRDMFGGLTLGSAVLIAAASAIGEELLFRAVLQPKLGLVGASVLFGLAHVPLDRSMWAWPVVATLAGMVLGGLYVYTEAAFASMVAHFVVNALNLAWLGSGATDSARSSR